MHSEFVPLRRPARHLLRVSCCAVLGMGALGDVWAQQATAPPSSCVRCTIRIDPVSTVGDSRDSVVLIPQSRLVWDRRLGFLAAPTSSPGAIAFYDDRGRQTRSVGRAGTGPGEFTDIDFVIVLPGGRVAVKDASGRMAVLSQGGASVRSAPMPRGSWVVRAAPLADGRVVVNNLRPGLPRLILLDTALQLVRGLGTPVEQRFPDPDAMQLLVTHGDSGTIIAVQAAYQYSIEIWDSSGAIRRRVAVESPWFRSYDASERARRGPLSPPLARITSIHYSGANRLWVTGLVADRRWRPNPQPPGRERARGPILARSGPTPVALQSAQYDTYVEVVDLSTGRVLSNLRMDELAVFVGGGLLAWQREEDDGSIRFAVARPVLTSRRNR